MIICVYDYFLDDFGIFPGGFIFVDIRGSPNRVDGDGSLEDYHEFMAKEDYYESMAIITLKSIQNLITICFNDPRVLEHGMFIKYLY
jgi:hypothetical protein